MPKLIVFRGLQGVGKSSIAKALSSQLECLVLSVDEIESSILESGVEKGHESGYAAYLVAELLAKNELAQNRDVIIDACNYVKEAIAIWDGVVANTGANLFYVNCILDEDIHRKRLESRTRNLYGMREIVWEDVLKRIEDTEELRLEQLEIDTAGEIEVSVDRILEYVESEQ